MLITHGWAHSLCSLYIAKCRGVGLRLISTEAMSAVTSLWFILLLMAQTTENTLYFRNEKYSRALIYIQQSVPEEHTLQCSKSHTRLSYTTHELRQVEMLLITFTHKHTYTHTHTHSHTQIYVCVCVCVYEDHCDLIRIRKSCRPQRVKIPVTKAERK